jgi:hypothetical protein
MCSESFASGGTGEEERPDYAVAQVSVQQTIASWWQESARGSSVVER